MLPLPPMLPLMTVFGLAVRIRFTTVAMFAGSFSSCSVIMGMSLSFEARFRVSLMT